MNGLLQRREVAEYAAADAFGDDLAEEAFDQVEPRAAGGDEVHVEARMSFVSQAFTFACLCVA